MTIFINLNIQVSMKFVRKTFSILIPLIFNRAILLPLLTFPILWSISFPGSIELANTFAGLIWLLLFPIYIYSYIPEIILRSYFKKHRAKKKIIFWYKVFIHILSLGIILCFVLKPPKSAHNVLISKLMTDILMLPILLIYYTLYFVTYRIIAIF